MSSVQKLRTNEKLNMSNNKSKSTYYSAKNKSVEMHVLVHNAAKYIAPVWPLETFIACNPLQGFENQKFEDALMQASRKFVTNQNNEQLQEVNLQMIKWCSVFFDAGQASIVIPHREKGFYLGFLKLAYFDKQLHKNQKEAKEFLKQLPESPEKALEICLQKLGVREVYAEEFFAKTFAYLPGWSGYVKWISDWKNSQKSDDAKVTLLEFLAVRMVLNCLLWPEAANHDAGKENFSFVNETLVKLKNKEDSYQKHLLTKILPEVIKGEVKSSRRNAQLVFCIDVRSEPFRRAIESLGSYETFGFAGFFGLPVSVNEFDSNKNKDCCPVLLKPKYAIEELAAAANKDDFERYKRGMNILNVLKKLYTQLKYNISTPFALAESLGLWHGLNMILKSLSPELSSFSISSFKNRVKPAIPTKVSYELSETNNEQGLSLQEQINYAQTVLKLMGLISGFAKIIVLCGHGSTTENNPYASALDCGACGGNHGGINARLLASILNKKDVRQGLENIGIHIPLDTVFYGALHNTTTDNLEIYTDAENPVIYPELLKQLKLDLNVAKYKTNEERGVKLGTTNPHKDITRRSVDWSETRPEWGLARNAAFIVAPRYITQNISLDGRCFLHSYRWEQDVDGSLLETILTAPMVVAEWINTQYLFSTLDNVSFGSGSKVTHNVVGTIGVMQGNGSDLMHGLPLQSVMSADQEAYHEPQRLLTIVYAPKELVSKVIEKHEILKTLFFNKWVNLIVVDPDNKISYQLDETNEWALVE